MTNKELENFDALWDYDDPAATEEAFRALLPAAEAYPALRLELLTQIARTEGLQRRFDDAHRTLDEVELLLTDGMPRARIRTLLERGRTFNSSGAPETARPLFEEAMTLAQDAGEDRLAVDAAHMAAIAAPSEETLVWNLRALEMAEQSEDAAARKWQGSLYNNIGWTYHEQSDYPKAFTYLEKARDFNREHGSEETYRIARWGVARVRRDLGQVDEALAEQRGLMSEYEALGRPSGYVFEEIAENMRLQGKLDEARPYFALAHEELSQDPWLVANEAERLERLRVLSA